MDVQLHEPIFIVRVCGGVAALLPCKGLCITPDLMAWETEGRGQTQQPLGRGSGAGGRK